MAGRAMDSDEEDEIVEEDDDRDLGKEAVGMDGREDDDEEDDEEEGQDEYEKDDFIVYDVEEEEENEEEDSGEERHRKKKKRKKDSEKNYVLDDDDYDLLKDNNVSSFIRRKPKPGSKFKRLKKAGMDNDGEERSGFSDDEEESDRNSKGGRTAEEKLKRSLFGDDDAAPLEDINEEEDQIEEEQDEDIIGEDDDMRDFIVDEDENGVVPRRDARPKKSRPGVSSSALQEAHDIFGDVDEFLSRRKLGRVPGQDELGENTIEKEFEPFILSERYMTPKDDFIRETDVPERMQLVEDITGPRPFDENIIKEEMAWIYNHLASGANSPLPGMDHVIKDIDKGQIGNVLEMVHKHKYDIPFIAMYRKELCSSLLKDPEFDMQEQEGEEKTRKMKWHKVLWAIHALDKKWFLLRKRKSALEMYYHKRFEEEARRIDDLTRLSLNRQLYQSVNEDLKKAKSEREVDDVDAKFNLHFPPGEVDVEKGQFKRPTRKSFYSTCHKAGLWEVANKFGVNSEQFGLLLALEKVRLDDVEDGKETPEEVAANFTCAMFETPQEVLKGARHMAAVEIGCEPVVKKHVRSVFMEKAVVSTSPTSEGNSTIDAFHQVSSMKWLRDKPMSEFSDAQWLLIQKAEEEKLLQVTIKLPEDAQKKLLADANEYYLSECVSRSAQLWNEQRKMILEDSFFTYILPSMEKEARSLLTARAKNWLLMEYGKQFWNKISVAPCLRNGKDDDDEEESGLRILACCWGPGKPATTFVMLDSAGEMLDVLYAGSINIRSKEDQRKKNDHQRLLKFIIDHQPQFACLGAANISCSKLKEDIYEVLWKLVEHHPREYRHDAHVSLVDESLPRLYEDARVSSDQLPGQPGIVKRAVAVGRIRQNPLAMVATLCGPGKEILSWKLCPLQDFLTPDEKYEVVEQLMVDATNQVGVDINLAASHEWQFAPLQFVSGLGPRKASALQRAFVRAGSVFNRKEIPMNVIKKKVFINAVGFLRVRRSGAAAASSHIMDLLDDTRIHPESYELAKKLAKDVYDAEDAPNDPNEMDDDAQEMAIEHVRERPDMLNGLKIDEYAKSYLELTGKNKRETLDDIKMELLHGFQDSRTPFSEPNPEDLFSMISCETEDALAEGRIVQVSIRHIQDKRILCNFDSGLTGIINEQDFSDDGFNLENLQVREGDVITAKIISVNKERFIVNLTSKQSELRRRPAHNPDPYYYENTNSLPTEQEKARKEKELAKKHFKPRMIVHPRFQNLTADEAMEYLSDKDAGESIVRPSSKGPQYLTLTLKIYDRVYAHKDIVEGGKDHKDMTSLLCLGKTLKIDGDTFEDLDEVIDRYVDPLVSRLKNMLGYRKFKRGTKAEIDDQLRAEKAENPMRIVYYFGISHEHPGTFILSYIRNSNPHHEYIGLYPKGFRFRKKDFDDLDRLVAYFQKNIDKPQVPLLNIAAHVQMKSPGQGTGDGWRGHTPDGERSSTPGSRTGGRFDNRDNGGGRDGHPSGIPRPGRGRGRGRGNNSGSDVRDGGFGTSGWGGSGSKDKDNNDDMSSFPGSKVQNSPGREWFPGGGSGGAAGGSSAWGGGGGGNSSAWGGGDTGGSSGGWGSSSGGTGGSEWGVASKRLVPPQADGGNAWSGGGSSSGGW